MSNKRSVIINGERSSVSLEEPFWDLLREFAAKEQLSINDYISAIEDQLIADNLQINLSSACRLRVLSVLKKQLARAREAIEAANV